MKEVFAIQSLCYKVGYEGSHSALFCFDFLSIKFHGRLEFVGIYNKAITICDKIKYTRQMT